MSLCFFISLDIGIVENPTIGDEAKDAWSSTGEADGTISTAVHYSTEPFANSVRKEGQQKAVTVITRSIGMVQTNSLSCCYRSPSQRRVL